MRRILLVIVLYGCLTAFVQYSFLHKQMDSKEYAGEFDPVLAEYFNGYDVRYNFCGVMTLMNTLDMMSVKETNKDYDISTVELVNKYFVEDGKIATVTDGKGSAFRAPNGSMNPTAVYYMADKIGEDTGFWEMRLVYGKIDFTVKRPIEVADLPEIVTESKKRVFDKGGVLIAHIGIADKGVFSYYHFLVITDMRLNSEGEAEMYVIDSLGKKLKGHVGWVNILKYTTPLDLNVGVYTGIYNLYGVIPQGEIEWNGLVGLQQD